MSIEVEETKYTKIRWNGSEIYVEPDCWELRDSEGRIVWTGNAESLRDFDNFVGKARERMNEYGN